MTHAINIGPGDPPLSKTLYNLVKELAAVRESLAKDGIIVEIDEVDCRGALRAEGGTNAISRLQKSTSGAQVKRETVPSITETSTSGIEVTTEESTPTVMRDEGTKESSQRTENGTNGGNTVTTDQTIEAG